MCKYCKDKTNWGKPIYNKSGTRAFIIDGMVSVIRECPIGCTVIPINFCPMCGRKLKDSD